MALRITYGNPMNKSVTMDLERLTDKWRHIYNRNLTQNDILESFKDTLFYSPESLNNKDIEAFCDEMISECELMMKYANELRVYVYDSK